MKIRTLAAVCTFAANFIAFAGCKGSAAADDKPTATGDGWLTGAWTGDFTDKNAPTDSSLRQTTAKATFTTAGDDKNSNTNTSRRGAFTLWFPDQGSKGATVTGTLGDFQGKSVMMVAQASDLPAIFPVKKQVTLDYELISDSLELDSDRIQIRLLRDDSGTGSGSGSTAVSSLVGDWKCIDAKGHNWEAHVKSETVFSFEVKQPGVASLWLDGTTSLISNDPTRDAEFRVATSSDASYVGLMLSAKIDDETQFEMSRYGTNAAGNPQVLETFPCSRDN